VRVGEANGGDSPSTFIAVCNQVGGDGKHASVLRKARVGVLTLELLTN
jgi:hypothetical protein